MKRQQNVQLFVTDEEEDTTLSIKIDDISDTNLLKDEKIEFEVSNDTIDNNEEDDPIIEEIPINIAGKDENLHVFQYANKPKLVGRKRCEHPYISEARMKPKSSLW